MDCFGKDLSEEEFSEDDEEFEPRLKKKTSFLCPDEYVEFLWDRCSKIQKYCLCLIEIWANQLFISIGLPTFQ